MSNGVIDFFWTTGIGHVLAHPDTVLNLLMMGFGLILIALGIVRKFEPLLLIPIGFGMMMGNVPLSEASPAAEGVIH